MVFLGNRHQSFPTSVVKDPVLEPVDKLVWMAIMLAVPETGGNTRVVKKLIRIEISTS